jgi:Plasmid encoded RepA protein
LAADPDLTLVQALRAGLETRSPQAPNRTSPPAAFSDPADLARFHELWATREALSTSHEKVIQAKALIFCSLPYRRVDERSVIRRARLGPRSHLSVTFTAVDPGHPLPYGADRALLGWIQTRGYADRFITFRSLTDFFDAFDLSRSGRDYSRFRERLARLLGLAITVRVEGEREEAQIHMQPLKKAFTPKTHGEVERALLSESSAQLLLVRNRYGFELDADFHAYLRANPVPLPLPLMRLFHNRPQSWDFASFVIYRCFAARTTSTIAWSELNEQMASTDTYPRRLKAHLNQVLQEVRVLYPGFPAQFLPGRQGLSVAPWRPALEAVGG